MLLPAESDHEQRSWQAPSAHIDLRGDGGYVIAPHVAALRGRRCSRRVLSASPSGVDVSAVTRGLRHPERTRPGRTGKVRMELFRYHL